MNHLLARTLAGGAAVLAVCLATSSAAAYVPSPQYGAVELKFGPYKPAVDENPSLGGAPYRRTFGDGSMFLTEIEVDWQFIHPPGFSLGIGGSIGFMQEYAKSFVEADGGTGDSLERSEADYTVLNVMPFALLAVVRLDALAEYLNVPLVPFFKIGLNWYVWWILGGGEVAMHNDRKGNGGTMGWQFSPGLAFQLDPLDRTTARTFDNEVGVNHSYIFVEMLWAFVDRFGNDDYMNLSTNNFANATVIAGLALEF